VYQFKQRKIDARSRLCLDGLDIAMLHRGGELRGQNGERPCGGKRNRLNGPRTYLGLRPSLHIILKSLTEKSFFGTDNTTVGMSPAQSLFFSVR